MWKILKEMGIPDHLTCHLRKLYADQAAIVRTQRETAGWFQIEKGVPFSPIGAGLRGAAQRRGAGAEGWVSARGWAPCSQAALLKHKAPIGRKTTEMGS